MKTKKSSLITNAAFIVLLVITISCGNSKRAAVPCPDFSHHKSFKPAHSENTTSSDGTLSQRRTSRKNLNLVHLASRSVSSKSDNKPEISNSQNMTGNMLTDVVDPDIQDKLAYMNSLTASVTPYPIQGIIWSDFHQKSVEPKRRELIIPYDSIFRCDTVVFKAGNEIMVKVIEIGLNEIKYRECENLQGPVISLLKSDVFVIKYPNGTRDFFNDAAPVISTGTVNKTYNATPTKTEGLGTAGFIASILGLLIAGIPLGTFAIIAGIISQGKIKKYPERFKGKGLATAAIIIGLLDVIGVLIYLATI
jgi:hypothetical protein